MKIQGTSRTGRSPSGLGADSGRPKSQNNASPGLFPQNYTITSKQTMEQGQYGHADTAIDNLSPSPSAPRAPSPSGGSSNTKKTPPVSKGFPFGKSSSGSVQPTPNNGIFNTSLSGFASPPPLSGGSGSNGGLFGSASGPFGGTSSSGVQDTVKL